MVWRGIVCAVLALCAWAAPAAAAPPILIGPDGKTAPIHDYEQAVRQRVHIPQPGIDQDLDGAQDWIAVEVMRPQGAGPGTEVPAIVDASPYYSTTCRGNEGECIADVDGDGRNDRWPLFVDNYFVPRGYAYVLAEMNGTANSQGCPLHGSEGDIAGMKSVIDWLAGRIPGYNQPGGTPSFATWSAGKAAMIGKSYDGTLANGVAATGVDGLETIIPISAISDWYRYSHQSGLLYSGWTNHYPATLSNLVTDVPRRPACAAARAAMSAADGDATGDMNPFWDQRNYVADVGQVEAAVFATHGFQDDNVKLDHFGVWWEGLAANDVPRKLWLLRGGHVDPFDSRRAEWVDTLHRWLDHWLLGVQNGIMATPRVSVEESADTWQDYADWPLPGSTPVPLYLRGTAADAAGGLGLSSGGALDSVTWTAPAGADNETQIISTPQGAQVRRRVFLSAPLEAPLRISGTPVVDIRASFSTERSNLGAVLVDYGPSTQVTRNDNGIVDSTERDCWGASTTREFPPGTVVDHGACYLKVTKPVTNVTQWRIARGVLDSANRNSLTSIEPVTPGASTRFSWPLIPQEHVIPAGHQLGVVLVANYSGLSQNGPTGTTFTLDTKASKVLLPVVGGYRAAAATRAFSPETTAPVMSGVPDDIAVDVADPTGAIVDYTLPTATDDETPDPLVVCDPAPGTRFPVGATQVTCTASDAYGNETVRAFTVTVVDTTPDTTAPVLAGMPADLSTGAEDAGGAIVTYTLPTATDDKTGAPLVVCDPVAGSKFPVGTTTVTCTATDDAGNAATATFEVTVAPLPDTTPPVLVGMPGDIVLGGEGGAGAILAYTLPTATDDKTAHPHVVCQPAPGTRLPVGAHRVTCTATDGSGNRATSAFTVTVTGPGSPPPTDGGGGGAPPTGDDVPRDVDPDADSSAPLVRVVRIASRGRAVRVRITLSEDARVRVVVKRRGRKLAARTVRLRAGTRVVTVRGAKLDRRGRFVLAVIARDGAGNAAPAVKQRFKRR